MNTGPIDVRKRPVAVQAYQYTGDNGPAVAAWIGADASWSAYDGLVIHTLEGDHIASPGDWVIRGVENEHYPCKASIFNATYEVMT